MSNLDLEKIRSQCVDLATRIKADPAFKEQVINDPESTLSAQNLPAEVIPDFLREVGLAADVQGYSICHVTCTLSSW